MDLKPQLISDDGASFYFEELRLAIGICRPGSLW